MLIGIENVTGSAFNDTFVADDIANKLIGGKGVDTVVYKDSAAGVTDRPDRRGRRAPATSRPATSSSEIENVVGSALNDNITGNDSNNLILGGGAPIRFTAGAGNDTLKGDYRERSVRARRATSRRPTRSTAAPASPIRTSSENDVVVLDGDYSAGVKFTATTMVKIETIQLTAANDYSLTLHDATNSRRPDRRCGQPSVPAIPCS